MILEEACTELLSHLVSGHLDVSKLSAGFVLFLLVFFVLLSLSLVSEVAEDVAELYSAVVFTLRRRYDRLNDNIFR